MAPKCLKCNRSVRDALISIWQIFPSPFLHRSLEQWQRWNSGFIRDGCRSDGQKTTKVSIARSLSLSLSFVLPFIPPLFPPLLLHGAHTHAWQPTLLSRISRRPPLLPKDLSFLSSILSFSPSFFNPHTQGAAAPPEGRDDYNAHVLPALGFFRPSSFIIFSVFFLFFFILSFFILFSLV